MGRGLICPPGHAEPQFPTLPQDVVVGGCLLGYPSEPTPALQTAKLRTHDGQSATAQGTLLQGAALSSRVACQPMRGFRPLKKEAPRTWGSPQTSGITLYTGQLVDLLSFQETEGYWWPRTLGGGGQGVELPETNWPRSQPSRSRQRSGQQLHLPPSSPTLLARGDSFILTLSLGFNALKARTFEVLVLSQVTC